MFVCTLFAASLAIAAIATPIDQQPVFNEGVNGQRFDLIEE